MFEQRNFGIHFLGDLLDAPIVFRVLRLVLGQGMRLAIAGAVLGIALALALMRYAKSLLFGVGAADPVTFAAVTALLIGVTLLAGGQGRSSGRTSVRVNHGSQRATTKDESSPSLSLVESMTYGLLS